MTTGWRSVTALAVLAAATIVVPRNLNAAGQAPGAADADLPVILAVGESTTAGYGVDREDSYPGQLQKRLNELGYHYRVVNHGVSGSTTQGALTRLDRGMALKPRFVIIALGGNDGGSQTPIATTRANMAKLISMFKRVGAEVFVTDRNLSRGSQDGSSVFAELAREHHAVLMPPLTLGVSGNPDLTIEDRSHPNAAGYTIVVRNILAVIEPYLKKDVAQIRP
jgi:acyl-CoA thioesterase-1